jgi:hypothetical protein
MCCTAAFNASTFLFDLINSKISQYEPHWILCWPCIQLISVLITLLHWRVYFCFIFFKEIRRLNVRIGLLIRLEMACHRATTGQTRAISSEIHCGLVFRVPGYRSRCPGFDSRRYQIFWEVVGLERGPLSLVRITEELLEWRSSGFGLEIWK